MSLDTAALAFLTSFLADAFAASGLLANWSLLNLWYSSSLLSLSTPTPIVFLSSDDIPDNALILFLSEEFCWGPLDPSSDFFMLEAGVLTAIAVLSKKVWASCFEISVTTPANSELSLIGIFPPRSSNSFFPASPFEARSLSKELTLAVSLAACCIALNFSDSACSWDGDISLPSLSSLSTSFCFFSGGIRDNACCCLANLTSSTVMPFAIANLRSWTVPLPGSKVPDWIAKDLPPTICSTILAWTPRASLTCFAASFGRGCGDLEKSFSGSGAVVPEVSTIFPGIGAVIPEASIIFSGIGATATLRSLASFALIWASSLALYARKTACWLAAEGAPACCWGCPGIPMSCWANLTLASSLSCWVAASLFFSTWSILACTSGGGLAPVKTPGYMRDASYWVEDNPAIFAALSSTP